MELVIAYIGIGFCIGCILSCLVLKGTIKRLERMNAKALVTVCELEDAAYIAAEELKEHRRSHRCLRKEKEVEWPEVIEA